MIEPFNELTDADIHRVDLVSAPANGVPFLIAKSAGLVDAEQVRDLIAKATISTADQNDKPDSDFAYIEPGGKTVDGKTEPRSLRHFYIGDADHVRNALARASQSPFGSKAMPKIEAAAKKFNIDVSKAADEPLPDADEVNQGLNLDGDPDDPESPAWEAVDAKNAQTAIDLAVALRRMVCAAQDREQQEAAVGADGDDAGNVMDLDQALCAIDCVISILAPFAVCEQAEADSRQADLEQLTKGQVRKAGRVLSGANEQGIRQAAALLEKVLATLPAPTDDGEQGMQVEKAKGDPQVAVYTADGKLVGVVDPADISPVASAEAADKPDDSADDGDDASVGEAADAENPDAPTPESDDTQDAAVIPGTDTVQAPADDTPVTKSADDRIAELVKAALEDRDAHWAAQIDVLKGQIEAYGATPAPGGPRLNGAAGTAGLVPRDDTDPAESLRKQAEQETDPKAKERLSYAAALAGVRKAQEGRGTYVGGAPVNAEAVLRRFTR